MNRFDQLTAPPVFVVGAARSGTTWVHDILDAHPLIAAAYETWLFTPKGLGALFGDAHYPSSHSGLGKLLPRERMVEHARALSQALLSHAIGDGHRYLVEKSPNHLFHTGVIREVFPNARFIHVIRDGRDVSVSVQAAVASWQPEWGRTFGASIESHARAWRHAVQRGSMIKQELGEDYIEVRYESLRRNPKQECRRLLDFVGAPHDVATVEEICRQTDFELNHEGGEDRFRRAGRVGDWKTSMGRLARLRFHRVAGSTLVDLGYARSSFWWWKPE